ncbi:glycosyltransferase family 1 protein [Orrella sp. JC864]|uniref:glycosyltransferase family 4 protein n=1 Tax=Orrella sp. JC864 TaxID=3120298 RepID=UPI0030089DFA
MKLVLGSESLRPPLTGIGNYTFHLLAALLRKPQLERIDCFSDAGWASAAQALAACERMSAAPAAGQGWLAGLKAGLRSLPFAYPLRAKVRELQYARRSGALADWVYHEPNFILKPHPGPSVVTVHDLSFVHYPAFHPPERVRWLNRELPGTLARACHVLTVSELVRQELIEQFAVPASKVSATHLGVSAHFRPCIQTDKTLQAYGLEHGRYLAFVGTLEPRKGLDVLLDAYLQLPAALRRAYPLAIAGASGWQNSALLGRMERLRRTGEIRLLSYLPLADLPAFYSGAAVFVYPSVYEGFGLPVLEAMACGAPVVIAAGTAMQEFCGVAGTTFPAGQGEALAQVLGGLLEDPVRRQAAGRAGPRIAARHSWDRCAELTIHAYEHAAKA